MNKQILSSKLFALGLIVILTIMISMMLQDFITPILLAIISAYVLYPLFSKLCEKTKKKQLSALIITILMFVIFLVPVVFMGGSIYSQVQSFDFNLSAVSQIEQTIEDITGVEFSITQSINSVKENILENLRSYSQNLISYTTSFLIGLFLYAFLLYYLFIEKDTILTFIYEILPFSHSNTEHIMTQSGFIVKALLIGQVLTAIIQGTLGMISFIIAGIEGAIFWGIIMIILSLIPMVGAFLVWFPAGLILLFQGNIAMGIFVLVWGSIVVSQIDNIIRPILVNRYFKVHPLFIIVGVFAGLSMFGVLGIIIGPLIFELFVLIYTTYKKEYGIHPSKS
ncbi:MAG: AI-2E family transporter [Candidatus Nanoarchaeia archaeon]